MAELTEGTTTAPPSPSSPASGTVRFVVSAAGYHAVTYFVAGVLASRLLDYAGTFEQLVIRDYYLPYGTVDIVWSGLLQVVRGVVFGLVLLPFRDALRSTRLGWLWLWLLFVGLGIVGTPAAAPASLEGVLYSRLPLWFHLFGLPEVLLQTLVFSIFVHRGLRAADHPLPRVLTTALNALATTSVSFVGYTVASLGFAFAAGVGVAAGSDPAVLGQFVAPLVFTFVTVLVVRDRWWLPANGTLYVLSSSSLAAYQGLVLGSVGWPYVVSAPILPVLISLVMTRPRCPRGASSCGS